MQIKPLSIVPYAEVLLPLACACLYASRANQPAPAIAYAAMNVVSYALHAADKSRAERGEWRISERTLYISVLLGGLIGAYAAQQTFHHKTRKLSYQIVFWVIVSLHDAFWIHWMITR